MATFNTPNITTGFDSFLVDLATEVPLFTPMFLVFIYILIFWSGVRLQGDNRGYSDIPFWGLVASVATMLVALSATMIEGLITLDILAIVVSIVILNGIWFFLSGNRSGQ